jgi:hypothetical protein
MKKQMWALRLVAVALVVLASAAMVVVEPAAAAATNTCADAWAYCTAGCGDLVGTAKGFCLRQCRAEYDDCLRGN